MTRALLLLLLLSANPLAAIADGPPDVSALLQQAEAKALAHHPYWKALLHYRAAGLFATTGLISDINSPGFFIASTGRTDPAAELTATLQAFFTPATSEPDNHAQCRFVARYRWLRQSLDWGSLTPPQINCPSFSAWSHNGQIESLSLIFASGYLSNPASLHGHILLKFNTRRADVPLALLDESMNFGAIVPKNELGMVYVLKGLFGGYDAVFSNERFYRFNHSYAETELRDLWEYELELSKDEVDQIVTHSWELLGNQFTYYFINENCAYHMAELLELVVNQPLMQHNLPWSLPSSVFERLATVQRHGSPLVRTVRRIASRQNRYYENFSVLTTTQKMVASELVNNTRNFGDPTYRVLHDAEKISLVDTLFDYYEFRIATEDDDREFKQAKQKLLSERAALPIQTEASAENHPIFTHAAPPHYGPKPGMIRLGLFNNNSLGTGMELRLRPTYYDLLSPDTGRIANSSLAMFDLRTVVTDNQLRLRSLDLVNIETLNVARTPLPGDGGMAWKIKFGFETQRSDCSDCVAFNITGGLGKAIRVSKQITTLGMVELFAESEGDASGIAGVMPRVSLMLTPNENWKSLITLGQRIETGGSQSTHRVIRWENRFGSSRDWDIRLTYDEQIERELQLAASFYW